MDTQAITLKTSYLRYTIEPSGVVSAFEDVRSGVNYARKGALAFYLLLSDGAPPAHGVTPPSARVAAPALVSMAKDGLIRVQFAEPAAEFSVRAACFDEYITMTLESLPPADVDFGRFVICGCRLTDEDGTAPFSGSALALSMELLTLETPGYCTDLGAQAFAKLPAAGCTAALTGMPRALLGQALRSALSTRTLKDVLYTKKGGPWALETKGASNNYAIAVDAIDFSDESWVLPFKRSGVDMINFHQGVEYRHSDYVFDPVKFPGGAAQFKEQVTDVLHRHGIAAALHTYSAMVDMKSEFVTPVPSGDLHMIAAYTLAWDLDETDDVMHVVEDIAPIPMDQFLTTKGMRVMMIGEELIEFHEKGEGNTLCRLVRGAYGTRVSAHKKGETARNLENHFSMFHAELGSPLFYALARRMADAYNQGGFDGMYFDGLDINSHCAKREKEGLCWYYDAMFVREVLRYTNSTPLIEYSTMNSLLWGARTQHGAWDYPSNGYPYFIDRHCAANVEQCERRLLNSQLGWFNFYPPKYWRSRGEIAPNWGVKIPFAEDMDYLGTKLIGHNAGFSYVVHNPKGIEAYPRYDEFAGRIGRYADARREHSFSPEIREALRRPRTGYRLLEEGGRLCFERQERLFARPHSLQENENTAVVQNPMPAQQPIVRLIAQHTADIGAEPKVLLAFDRDLPAQGQVRSLNLAEDPGKPYIAEHPLVLSGHEALGLWVKGNGRNEYMSVRLNAAEPNGIGQDDHIVPLNFTGWRFVTLCEPDNGDYPELTWRDDPAAGWGEGLYAKHLFAINYKGIASVYVLFSENGDGVCLGDLCAYPVDSTPVRRPSVTIGGKTVHFETELAPGCYLELAPGEETARLYDVHGLKERVAVAGMVCALETGANAVALGGEAEGSFRLKLNMIVYGEKLFA